MWLGSCCHRGAPHHGELLGPNSLLWRITREDSDHPQVGAVCLVQGPAISTGQIKVKSDCLYVVEGYYRHTNKGGFRPDLEHGDLWAQVLKLAVKEGPFIGQARFRVELEKVPAHCEEEHMQNVVLSPGDLYGNGVADKAAGRGAALIELSESDVEAVKEVDRAAQSIQRRLVDTTLAAQEAAKTIDEAALQEGEENAQQQQPKERAKGDRASKKAANRMQAHREAPQNLAYKLELSGHCMVQFRSSWRCKNCLFVSRNF